MPVMSGSPRDAATNGHAGAAKRLPTHTATMVGVVKDGSTANLGTQSFNGPTHFGTHTNSQFTFHEKTLSDDNIARQRKLSQSCILRRPRRSLPRRTHTFAGSRKNVEGGTQRTSYAKRRKDQGNLKVVHDLYSIPTMGHWRPKHPLGLWRTGQRQDHARPTLDQHA